MFTTDVGSGTPLLLIPGLGARHEMYRPQITDLSSRMRVLAPDLRGCGESEPLGHIPVDAVIDTQVTDLLTWLDNLGIGRVHVAGISYGGVVAERMMIDHPDRVASAVICDSLCDTRPRSLIEWLKIAPARLQPVALRLPRSWLTAGVTAAYRQWPEAGREMAAVLTTGNIDDLVLQRRAVNAVHHERRLQDVRVPTLCLVGDHNRFAVDMMRRTHHAIPGSEFALIPNSFDPSSLCNPSTFTHHLVRWVEQHS